MIVGGALALIGVGVGFYLRSSSSEEADLSHSLPTQSVLHRADTKNIESDGIASEQKNFVPKNYSPAIQGKIDVLRQILRSHNDNDPRLDTDFKDLSDEMKDALREMYGQLPPEDRNGRGTIAFLLARALAKPEELRFFGEVLSEAPCLSLADCTKEPHLEDALHGEHHDEELGGEVTLAYPQLVSMQWFEQILEDEKRAPIFKKAITELLEQARRSKVDKVSVRADEILKQHP